MASEKLSPQEIEELQQLAKAWGKIVARRASQDGQRTHFDFAELERIAGTVADGLTQGTIEQLCDLQARQLPQQLPCPACHHLCLLQRRHRTLQTDSATSVQIDEPFAHCLDCRRDFFPPQD